MPTPNELLIEAIRSVLAAHGAAAPERDTDTLAGLVASGIEAAGLTVTQTAPAEAGGAGDEPDDHTSSAFQRWLAGVSGKEPQS